MDWEKTNDYLKAIKNELTIPPPTPLRIASFDLDDTLTMKKSPTEFIHDSLPNKIAELVEDNYIIIVFTNQAGLIKSKKQSPEKWMENINNVQKSIMSRTKNYYFAIYVALSHDLHRKPNIELWKMMKKDLQNAFNFDKLEISKKSFYCGDAAGRTSPSVFKKKLYKSSRTGDFADSDRKFALNVKLPFITPEEFYLDEDSIPDMPYTLSGIDPSKYIMKKVKNNYHFVPRKKEMIIMVGMPGSGKSYFVKTHLLPHGYVHINQDTLKTKVKCLEAAKNTLSKEKSLVIDNTNPGVFERMEYTTMALDRGYNIRAIVMSTNQDLANHLNNVRHVYSEGSIPMIPDIVYNIFKRNYVKPQTSEHFDLIETVDFVFNVDELDDPNWRKIFMRWV